MNVINSVAVALQGQLGHALIYLAIVVGADVGFGVLVAVFKTKDFTLRKIWDFTVTTVGFEKTVAFLGALALMYLHGDQFTQAGVAGLALGYATTVLPDLYSKISTLIFNGALPLSTNLAAPPAKAA